MKNVELKIEGMTCAHCERTVEAAIGDAGGWAKADRKTGTVKIIFDDETVSIESFSKAATALGYTIKE